MQNTDADIVIQEIIEAYKKYGTEDSAKILQAYEYALKHHAGAKRKSGELYICHPVRATKELMVIEPDLVTILSTLLHDTIAEGTATLAEIEQYFGPEVARIVDALDKIGRIKYRGKSGGASIERLQRTLIAMAQDVRSIFVKFADRIHNLRTIQYHEDVKKAERIANESLLLYAPLASRLGLYAFKETLETLALRTLDLDGYLHVAGELAHYTLEQEQFLTQSVEKIRTLLPESFRGGVSFRVKSPYSIYRKLQQNGMKSIHDIYDVLAIRIVVDTVSDCYAVLGIIHGNFKPLQDRFKDFIAVPKSNGYQSLHTTILGLESYKQPIEIQIRTTKMDEEAERGTAAHVLYKMHGDTMSREEGYQDLVQTAMDTLLQNQGSLLGKKILFPTLFVFSPLGDVFELPHESTPIDFAYAIHSDVGYHAIGVRINGKIATLDTRLHDGDLVEILTSPTAHPVAQWLDFVVSSKARSQIDVEVKRLSGERAHIIDKWKKLLFDTFLEAGIELRDDLENFTEYYGSELDGKKAEELYYHIGQGVLKSWNFLPRRERSKRKSVPPPKILPHEAKLIVWGEFDIPHQMAGCCKPQYPVDVVAVLRTGGRCMIHSASCPRLSSVNPARMLGAYWHIGKRGKVTSFTMIFHDVPGLMSRITTMLYEMQVNIIDLTVKSLPDGTCRVQFRIEVDESDHSFLTRFIDRLHMHVPEFCSLERETFDKTK